MYSNFKEHGIEYAKQAVQEDHACNYAKAFPLYMNALQYFKTRLKYEKDPEIREDISQNFTYYLRRAEEIRSYLETGEIRPLSNNGDNAVAARLESNPKHEEENMNNFSPKPFKSLFKEQAIEYVKQAVAEDNAGCYQKAFRLYINALEYFKTHLKYEKNPKIREAISEKFTEYLRCAEEIRAVLDECWMKPSNGGDGAVAARLKMEPKDGEENTMYNYSPNLKQAMEYIKQAVQEDNAGNYSKALYLYMNALEYITTHLKYEENPKIREAITSKFTEYVRRVEDIRAFLDFRVEDIRAVLEEGGTTGAQSNGGYGPVAASLKTEPIDGEGSVGGGRELEIKRMVELNSAIVRDKPNVKSTVSQRLCSCFFGNT